ncbi:hypothetical protein [uncultured Microbacterium sp.]|uniref:hypothetical protein n=1 Tax=uncultured Microbacterium sp. TaxID=191216 RepID=UPI0025DA80C1|nr:hypothetical protein [uncultured Microbacterium sp.]
MPDQMKASELLARLQRHYIKPGEMMPGGAFLPEVVLGSRRADALYVGFFQSRGKHLVGHELKVSRADWLHELDQPEKAEAWEPNCHAWYVVAPSEDIVRREELPHGWGLMIPGRSKTRMTIVVKAALHPERNPSWEATHALVQKIDSLRMKSIADDRAKQREAMHAEVDEQVQRRVAAATGETTLQREHDRLREQVDQLQEILGFKIIEGRIGWDDDEITVTEIRESFARWVAADKDVQRAVSRRWFDLKDAERRIADAVQAITVLQPATVDA